MTRHQNAVTAVTGTKYGGEEAVIRQGETEHVGYHVYCEEGEITVSIDGKLVATLGAGEEGTFDLEEPSGLGGGSGSGQGGSGGGCGIARPHQTSRYLFGVSLALRGLRGR